MPKVLITGAAGFVGSHLAEFYLRKGFEVHGTVRERTDLENIRSLVWQLHLHQADVTDAPAVSRLVGEGFDVIHHLAAVTYVPTSWQYPNVVMQTNISGTLNFLEALRSPPTSRRAARGQEKTIFHFAGTSEEYGTVKDDELPIKEDNALRPTSPYAVSKVAADMLCQIYARAFGVRAVISRAFNHTGQRRGKQFVTRTICRQAAEIKKGLRDAFELGNVNASRDWTDVRDICKAYMLMAQKAGTKIVFGEPYNICTGNAYKIRALVDHIAKIARISNKVEVDRGQLRPIDNPVLQGDNTKFRQATGWSPTIDLLETLEETYRLELAALEGGLNINLPVPASGLGST